MRVSLEPWSLADLGAFHELASDGEVLRYINGGIPWTEEQAREFVTRQMRHYRERGYCMWKLMTDGVFAGFCGIQPTVVEGADEIEIGWWLKREFWGQGLVTEAAQRVMREYEGRLIAIIRPENARSIAVARRLGMSYERDAVYKGAGVTIWMLSR